MLKFPAGASAHRPTAATPAEASISYPAPRTGGAQTRRGRHSGAGHGSARLDAVSSGCLGMAAVLVGRAFCCYRRGSADAAVDGQDRQIEVTY